MLPHEPRVHRCSSHGSGSTVTSSEGGTIVEVGCGPDATFLRTMCVLTGGTRHRHRPRMHTEQRRGRDASRRAGSTLHHATLPGSALVCRHTLEHVAARRRRSSELRAWLGRRVIRMHPYLIEVPDAERIFRDGAFWDVYYEHCSYFTTTSLEDSPRSRRTPRGADRLGVRRPVPRRSTRVPAAPRRHPIVAPARRWHAARPSAVWRPSGSRVHTTLSSARGRRTGASLAGGREGSRGTRAHGRRRRDHRRRRRQSGQARPLPPGDVSLDTRPAGRIGARAAARRRHERRLRRRGRALPGRCRGHGDVRAFESLLDVAQVFDTTRRNCLVEHAVVEKVSDPPQADEPVTVEVLARQSQLRGTRRRARPRPRRAVHSNVEIGERPLEPSRSRRGSSAGRAGALGERHLALGHHVAQDIGEVADQVVLLRRADVERLAARRARPAPRACASGDAREVADVDERPPRRSRRTGGGSRPVVCAQPARLLRTMSSRSRGEAP